jgi:hypothetical protein
METVVTKVVNDTNKRRKLDDGPPFLPRLVGKLPNCKTRHVEQEFVNSKGQLLQFVGDRSKALKSPGDVAFGVYDVQGRYNRVMTIEFDEEHDTDFSLIFTTLGNHFQADFQNPSGTTESMRVKITKKGGEVYDCDTELNQEEKEIVYEETVSHLTLSSQYVLMQTGNPKQALCYFAIVRKAPKRLRVQQKQTIMRRAWEVFPPVDSYPMPVPKNVRTMIICEAWDEPECIHVPTNPSVPDDQDNVVLRVGDVLRLNGKVVSIVSSILHGRIYFSRTEYITKQDIQHGNVQRLVLEKWVTLHLDTTYVIFNAQATKTISAPFHRGLKLLGGEFQIDDLRESKRLFKNIPEAHTCLVCGERVPTSFQFWDAQLIDALKRGDISNTDMTVLWKHCDYEIIRQG